MKLLMMKNKKIFLKYFLSIIFLNLLVAFSCNNFYIEESISSNDLDSYTIEFYFDVKDSQFPTNVFPLYIKIEQSIPFSSSAEVYAMNYAYWECPTCFKISYDGLFDKDNQLLISFSDNQSFEDNVLGVITVDPYNLTPFYKIDYQLLYSESLDLIKKKVYDKSIAKLNFIIENSFDTELIASSKYLISEIYLNDFNNYDMSVLYLEDILNSCPQCVSEIFKKSLFSLSYIYANYLDYYSDAIKLYNDFIVLYPNDELISSVKYELELLSPYEKKIDELIQTSK